MFIREMTHNACIAVIADQRLARMACAKDNIPYVIPIYYAYDGNHLYAFSMPGKKVDFLRANPHACLQLDSYRDKHHWMSVIVDATYRELPNDDRHHDERMRAWSLLEQHFDWWEPGALKPTPQPIRSASPHVFFALDIDNVTGIEAGEEEDGSSP